MNLPSSLFPSIIEDKHSGLSTRKLFSALSSLKDDKVVMVASNKSEKTKVNPLYFDYTCSVTIQHQNCRLALKL